MATDPESEVRALREANERLRRENTRLERQLASVEDINQRHAELLERFEASQAQLEREGESLRLAKELAEAMTRTLRTSAGRLEAIVDHALEAIVTFSEDGGIQSFSRRAAEVFGYEPPEARGLPFVQLIDPSELEGGRAEWFEEQLDRGRDVTDEIACVRSTGDAFPAQVHLCRIETESGAMFTAIIRDLTEERQLQARLLQAEKLESIGRLAAGVAHEINTPIQYIGDNTHFLRDTFGEVMSLVCTLVDAFREPLTLDDARVAAISEEIERADIEYLRDEIPVALSQSLDGVDRVSKIVKAMKTFSHPGDTDREPIDLNQAIESTVTVSRSEWKLVAEMDLDLDVGLAPVPVFVGEFNQVVLNLIVNASHAIADKMQGQEKGRITVSTRAECDSAVIRVTDTGVGIPDDVAARIFDPFFTTKAVGRGTGQGLAIARSVVVEKHGGELSVESELGVGTTFIIRLPRELD